MLVKIVKNPYIFSKYQWPSQTLLLPSVSSLLNGRNIALAFSSENGGHPHGLGNFLHFAAITCYPPLLWMLGPQTPSQHRCGTAACFNFVLCRVGGGTTDSLLVNFQGGNDLNKESISLNYRILLLLPSVPFYVPQTLLLWEVTCRWDLDGAANLPLVFLNLLLLSPLQPGLVICSSPNTCTLLFHVPLPPGPSLERWWGEGEEEEK